MQIHDLHHANFEKFLEIFEICARRNSISKTEIENSPDEIRALRRRLDSRMNNALAYFRRRYGYSHIEILELAKQLLETYGHKKGRAYILKIHARKLRS